ncbi:hypothetical protein CO611_07780 [Lysobacteraceae bacterium NML03-0222]|nr:hypothetical protein CO611_07780 [Xanthomonadaceae bacterium NML03-0222]
MQRFHRHYWQGLALLLACSLLQACSSCSPCAVFSGADDKPEHAAVHGADTPSAAVTDLIAHLRNDDLPALARSALPAGLHAEVATAWQEGRSRWPLTELPLDDSIPKVLTALTQADAESRLQQSFRQQLSGQTRAMQDAARGLGVFGKEYLGREGHYNLSQRQHYTQLIDVFSSWAASAPLGDAKRGQQSIALLVKAAEQGGINSDEDFSRLGLDASLEGLTPLYVAIGQILELYGLDMAATLASVKVETVSEAGDEAELRVSYTLAGRPIKTVMQAVRVDGRWYLADYLQAARDSLAGSPMEAIPQPPPTDTQDAPAER